MNINSYFLFIPSLKQRETYYKLVKNDTLTAWEPLIVLMSLGSAFPIHTDHTDHCIKVQLSISKSDSHAVLGSVGSGNIL